MQTQNMLSNHCHNTNIFNTVINKRLKFSEDGSNTPP